ncbi:uncharacterized protein V6R79_023895 [Siganus canaliculatus]
MANTVLEVGTGVFVIALVWILALVFGTMLLRASGSAKLGVIPVFLLALTVTLALIFFPRNPETAPLFKEVEVSSALLSHTLPVLRPQPSTILCTPSHIYLPPTCIVKDVSVQPR